MSVLAVVAVTVAGPWHRALGIVGQLGERNFPHAELRPSETSILCDDRKTEIGPTIRECQCRISDEARRCGGEGDWNRGGVGDLANVVSGYLDLQPFHDGMRNGRPNRLISKFDGQAIDLSHRVPIVNKIENDFQPPCLGRDADIHKLDVTSFSFGGGMAAPLRFVGGPFAFLRGLPRVDCRSDGGGKSDESADGLKPSGPKTLAGDLSLRLSGIGGAGLLYQVVAIMAICFGFFATSVGCAKALSPISDGRDGFWLALGAAGAVLFRFGAFVAVSL